MAVSDQRDALVGRVALLLAATCAVIVTGTVLALTLPAVGERLRDRSPVAYSEGDVIDLDPATYRSAARTLYLFSRSSCGACQASKPVITRIVADLRDRSDVHVVLVTGNELPEEERVFASEVGIDPPRIHRTDLSRLRVRQVPTMVLADSSGTILMARQGLFTEIDRVDVVRMSKWPAVTGP